MALSIQDSRILIKRSTVAATVPTAAPSNDFTDGTWTETDIYVGELFQNVTDEKVFTRFTNNIRQIAVADNPTTNRLTYWNASGHLGNVAAPVDGQFLKYTTANGYEWAAAGVTGWGNVLSVERTTNGTSPFITANDDIQWANGSDTWVTTLTNDQATSATLTVYLPQQNGRLVIHDSATNLTSGRIPYVTTNGIIADISTFLYDAANIRMTVGTTSNLSTADVVNFYKNQNGNTAVRVLNNTSGTGALAQFYASANGGTNGVSMAVYSAGFTSSGIQEADTAVLFSAVTNGMNVGTSVSASLSFWTTGVKRMIIKAGGDINIAALPTSASGLSAGDLYTQTATQLGGSGSTKVICIV